MRALDPLNPKNIFNLKGYIIGNGITDFNFDGFLPQAPEVYSAFNIFPRYMLDDVRKYNCKYYNFNAFPDR
jgi:hypothetical protein